MVHLNPSDSLALQKIIIQMTYSESWLGSCEFGLHPEQKHPEQERPAFLISAPNLSGSCETQRGKGRGISSRFRRHELAEGWGWAGQTGRPWASRACCLAPHALLHQSVGHAGGPWEASFWNECFCCENAELSCQNGVAGEERTAPAGVLFSGVGSTCMHTRVARVCFYVSA